MAGYGRIATLYEILIGSIFEDWVVEDCPESIYSIDFNAIAGIPPTFDWGINCIGSIN